MYLLNTHFKENISIYKALSKITGIGARMAIQACDQLGVSQDVRLESLSPFKVNQLNQILYKNSLVENELRTLVRRNKTRLCSISCYRGFRHIEGLPCRGQRTHTNARSSRRQRYNALLLK